MPSTFMAWVFSVIVWLPTGEVNAPVIRAYHSLSECLTAETAAIQVAQEAANSNLATMTVTYHFEDCHMVTNTSLAKHI